VHNLSDSESKALVASSNNKLPGLSKYLNGNSLTLSTESFTAFSTMVGIFQENIDDSVAFAVRQLQPTYCFGCIGFP
jgi:hypothetical protein